MIDAVKAPRLELSVVHDLDTFAGMAEEWRSLAEQSCASFFMSWEWHYTWWQLYSTSKDRLYLVRFTVDDQLVGLLPMYSRPEGLLRNRSLLFLGTGEAREDEVATEYLDIVAHPSFSELVCSMALDWLASCESWAKVELRFMLEDADLVKAYRSREDLFVLERDVGFRYRANLSLDENEHMQGIGKSRVKRLERSRRAVIRDGGLTQHSVNSINELESAFHQLAELNHERQAHKRRKSVFASTKFNLFHRRLFERVYTSGAVNIHQFKIEHTLLAVVYCFYDERTCYYYQSGFAKRTANKYMPLTFAHLAEMQRNRNSGRLYYDFMRAEPPTYKADFGCETTPMVTTFLFCSNLGLKRFNAQKTLRRSLVRVLSRAGIKRT